MTGSACHTWRTALLEQARTGQTASWPLQGHMRVCPQCAQEWAAQQALTAGYRQIAAEAAAVPPRRAFREELLREFERRQPAPVKRSYWPRYAWSAVAAVLVISLGLFIWLARSKKTAEPVVQTAMRTLSAGGGFVSVPFVPPLASGEQVRIVRTKVPPAALLRMGLAVDASSQAELNAEIVLGEDGFPRAVRVF